MLSMACVRSFVGMMTGTQYLHKVPQTLLYTLAEKGANKRKPAVYWMSLDAVVHSNERGRLSTQALFSGKEWTAR
jgi:hypothetical protein